MKQLKNYNYLVSREIAKVLKELGFWVVHQALEWIYINYNIWLYVYQPNSTGYFAHNYENKAKYDTPKEAYNEGLLYILEEIKNN